MNYKEAQNIVIEYFENEGYTVKRKLKIPNATHPSNTFRLYFKTQSIYKMIGKPPYSVNNARSLNINIKDLANRILSIKSKQGELL